MAKKRAAVAVPAPRAALSSLADALRARGFTVAHENPDTSSAPPPQGAIEPADLVLARNGRIVVRRERKGHGGKTVTVVEGLGLSRAQLEVVARLMRKALGCGSWVEGGRVVLQGDLARGAEAWLRGAGAPRVLRGN